MGKPTDKSFQQYFVFGSVLLMLGSLLTTRVGLTISMILFLVSTCLHKNFPAQLNAFIRNRFLVGMSVLFLIPLLTGLWSEDTGQWLRSVRIKLPLLLFPIAFAGNWHLTVQQWRIIAWTFLVVVLMGCCWSLWQYAGNWEMIHQQYLKAKALPTPLQNDHIRFSLLVVMGVITSFFLFQNHRQWKNRWIYLIAGLFFIIYLHVLAARTGLLGLYLFVIAALVYGLIRRQTRKFALFSVAILILIPFLAWFFLPTFQNRVRYMVYDLQHIQINRYLPGSNDGSRLVSLKAGWHIMNEHAAGVGAGDVVMEASAWYEANVPEMTIKGLYPSSEWLMYGAAAGWAGFVLFSLIMLLPFFEKRRHYFFWLVISAVMASSFLFDIGLEVQFGVFIYAFVMLWWWKWLEEGSEL